MPPEPGLKALKLLRHRPRQDALPLARLPLAAHRQLPDRPRRILDLQPDAPAVAVTFGLRALQVAEDIVALRAAELNRAQALARGKPHAAPGFLKLMGPVAVVNIRRDLAMATPPVS